MRGCPARDPRAAGRRPAHAPGGGRGERDRELILSATAPAGRWSGPGFLARLVSDDVVLVEVFADLDGIELPAEEEAAVGRAVPSRRAEFATARACAREALGRLGLPVVAIPSDAQRRPVWPAGVKGSITHCQGYRGAALSRSGSVRGLGIDAEPNRPLTPLVRDEICTAAERRQLAALAPGTDCWDRALFSAKESVYKAASSAGIDIGSFLAVSIGLVPSSNTFSASFPTEAGTRFAGGHIAFSVDLVGSCVELR